LSELSQFFDNYLLFIALGRIFKTLGFDRIHVRRRKEQILEQITFEIMRRTSSGLRPLRRLPAQIHCAYAFAAAARSRGSQSIFKVKMLY
jgi:hypothetical protein